MEKMWIAREKNGDLWLFHEKPIYDEFLQEWVTENAFEFGFLPNYYFSDVTFENSPREIEINLK